MNRLASFNRIVLRTCPLALIAVTALPATGWALDKACDDAAKQYCSGMESGDLRLVRCLKQNDSKLNSTCRRSLEKSDVDVGESITQCQSDAAKLCTSVVPGAGRLMTCLKSHKAELSAGCAAQLK